MNWITIEELLLIHEQVILETGGTPGILNLGGLESALLRPLTTLRGEELFPNLWDKAAVLIHSLISYHPFADGNKRTALVAADVFFRLNGYRLVPSDEVEPFFWAIARGEKNVNEIHDWLKSHTESWEEH